MEESERSDPESDVLRLALKVAEQQKRSNDVDIDYITRLLEQLGSSTLDTPEGRAAKRKLENLSKEQHAGPAVPQFSSPAAAAASPVSAPDVNDPLSVPSLLRQVSALEQQGLLSIVEKATMKELLRQNNEDAVTWMRTMVEQKADAKEKDSQRESFKENVKRALEDRNQLQQACLQAQLEEVGSLLLIFNQELYLAQTRPFCLRIAIVLEAIDCRLELGFLMPALYPVREAVRVTAYIPPPFDGLENANLKALQARLEQRAREYLGAEGGSVYTIVEEAKEWVEHNKELLQNSSDADPDRDPHPEGSSVAYTNAMHRSVTATVPYIRPLPIFRDTVLGPGKIQQVVDALMLKVQQETGVSTATAKAKLNQCQWSVQATIRKIKREQRRARGEAVDSDDSDDEDTDEEDEKKLKQAAESKLNGKGKSSGKSAREQFDLNSADDSDAQLQALTQAVSAPELASAVTFTCLACMDEYPTSEGACMTCAHWLCFGCWDGYLTSKVSEGDPYMKCPGSKCPQYVAEEMIMVLLEKQEDYRRYRRWLQNAYIKLNGFKWCPYVPCANVGKAADELSAPVACACRRFWCFSCQKQAHWPVTCDMRTMYLTSGVQKDVRKEFKMELVKEELEQLQIQTKNCPACKTPWWKNGGCNHFSCSCGHEFCWVCMSPWKGHQGSYFQCDLTTSVAKMKNVGVVTNVRIGQVVNLDGKDLDYVRSYCEREVTHSSLAARVAKMRTPRQLAALQEHFPTVPVPLLDKALGFVVEAHLILRFSYMFLFIFAPHFEPKALSELERALNEDDEEDEEQKHMPKLHYQNRSKKPQHRQYAEQKAKQEKDQQKVVDKKKREEEMQKRWKEQEKATAVTLAKTLAKGETKAPQQEAKTEEPAVLPVNLRATRATRAIAISLLREMYSFEFYTDLLDQSFIPRYIKLRRTHTPDTLFSALNMAQRAAESFYQCWKTFSEATWQQQPKNPKEAQANGIQIVNYFAEHESRLQEQATKLRAQGFKLKEEVLTADMSEQFIF